MVEKFTEKEEKMLRQQFPDYSDEQLKDFIAHAIAKRGLLILSSDPKDAKEEQRKQMLKILERLQGDAIKELNRRKLKKVV